MSRRAPTCRGSWSRAPVSVLPLLALAAVPALSACRRAPRVDPSSHKLTPIVLFDGEGTSPNDVKAVEAILRDHGLAYSTADTRELAALGRERLRAFRLLIVPGGNFEQMGHGLDARATGAVRGAVQDGLGYLGICAGAFLAGRYRDFGFDLAGGVRFPFYAAEARGVRKAAVPITLGGGRLLEQYWEDGPELTGWGTSVARYPEGTPAIVEGEVGKGWVVLSGVHPEAPESWRGGLGFTTSARASHELAAALIAAALNHRSLSAE